MHNKYKSLSIVIPVYNEERFIGTCLGSIAAQTQPPDEVIVIDNNSTDKTAAIARSYPFVTVVQAREQGIVHARDAGFNAATSDIIGRIDADTVLPRGWSAYVRRFYDIEKHQRYALSGGGYFYNIRMPRFNGWIQGQLAYRVNRFIVGHYVLWGSNMAFPRELWLQVRSKTCTRQDVHEDLDLSFHLHDLGVPIAYDESLRVGVYLKRVFSSRRSLRKHMRLWPQTLKTHHYHLWWIGIVGNWFLWYIMQPLVFAMEFVARLFGHQAKTG
jgi:glycosyltransferase involved in cell wall biosynthesis